MEAINGIREQMQEEFALKLSNTFMCYDCPIAVSCKRDCLANWKQFISEVMEGEAEHGN